MKSGIQDSKSVRGPLGSATKELKYIKRYVIIKEK